MNSHLLKKNKERFDKLNITKWQEKGITGKGVRIGIIGFSPSSHHNGAELISQIALNSEIIEYNVMDNDTYRYTWEEAFTQMIKDKVQVVCSSLRKKTWSTELEQLSKAMYKKNVILIDSSDNEGEIINAYPALSKYWFVIGAYDERRNNRAGYSSYGEKLFGLGYTDYVCKNYKGNYIPISHTSGATQIIAGMAAMLKESSNITPDEFKEFMISNAIKLSDKDFDIYTGYGLLSLPDEVKIKTPPKNNNKESEDNMFKDVKPNDWYYKAVKWAKEKGILKGYDGGTFRPNQPLTRAEYAQAEYNKAHKQD